MDTHIYTQEEIPPVMGVEEVAKFLGIGRNRTYDLVRAGQIGALHFGRKIRIPRHCLLKYLGVLNSQQTT